MSISHSKFFFFSLTTLGLLLGSCSRNEEETKAPAGGSETKPQGKTALGTALYESTEKNEYEKTKSLIEAGADVNFQGDDKKTPLMVTNSPEITKLLLEHGADPTMTSAEWYNRDVPYYKVRGNSYEAFCLVLEKCKQHQIENSALAPNGVFGPPLMQAIDREEQAELYVEALLKKGANVNWVSNDSVYGQTDSKYTPLILAAKRGNLSVVKMLLQYHPAISAENRYGESAANVATTEEIRNLLREAAKKSVQEPASEPAAAEALDTGEEGSTTESPAEAN